MSGYGLSPCVPCCDCAPRKQWAWHCWLWERAPPVAFYQRGHPFWRSEPSRKLGMNGAEGVLIGLSPGRRRRCLRLSYHRGKRKPRLRADSRLTEAYAGDFMHNCTHGGGSCRVKLTTAQTAALDRSVAPARMRTYLVAAGQDLDRARELYLWDRELSVAFLADLAILEVALRNSMNARLVSVWGAKWFQNQAILLDDRSCRALADAWGRTALDRSPDRIVAQCMFGFWRGLLDKGDYVGQGPRRVRCDYEQQLWRGVLDKAFPGGKAHAAQDAQRWNRTYALAVVSRVNDLRNRVAHHEPLINGLPLTGQQARRTAQEAHADCMRLAGMLDRDLASLLDATSLVPSVLAGRPQ